MRRARHLVWIVPVVLAALLVGLRPLAESRHWNAMLADVAAVEARLGAPRTREPVVGPAEDGRAWAHYRAAFAAIEERGPVDLADELDGHAAALAALRRGLRARDLSFAPGASFELGTPGVPVVEGVHLLARLCVVDAERHLDAGRPRDAARCLLEGVQLGRDLLGHPGTRTFMNGAATLVSRPLREFLERRGLAELSAPALDDLEAGLAHLDAAFPRALPCLESGVVRLAREAEDGVPAEYREGSTWRYLGSERVAFADGVRAALEHLARLGPAPAEISLATLDERYATWRTAPQPLVRRLAESWALTIQVHRDAVVELRALRCALAVARGRPAPPVEDPFGFTATVTEEEGAVVVRVTRRFSSFVEVRVRR